MKHKSFHPHYLMAQTSGPMKEHCQNYQRMKKFDPLPWGLLLPQSLYSGLLWYPHNNVNDIPSVPVYPLCWPSQENMCSQDITVEWIKFQKVICFPICKTTYVPNVGSEVFVKNLPPKFLDEELIDFFEKAGDIFKIRIMMDENRLENRGFCYVTYLDNTMAKRAVDELNNREFQKNVYLILESSLNNCRIFMGGIPTHKTKNEVWQELYKFGVKNVVDVIMYRSYNKRSENRGFVFIEFQTHEQAAHFRAKYIDTLELWGSRVIIDWSVPMPEVDQSSLEKVKIIYLRNLDVIQTPQELECLIACFTNRAQIEKVYKFKNYAFIHLKSREIAEQLLHVLKGYYKDSDVEITWAKPANKFTTQEYRQLKVRSLSTSRSRNNSTSSNMSLLDELSFDTSPRKPSFRPSPQSMKEKSKLVHARECCTSSGSYDLQGCSSRSNSSNCSLYSSPSPSMDLYCSGQQNRETTRRSTPSFYGEVAKPTPPEHAEGNWQSSSIYEEVNRPVFPRYYDQGNVFRHQTYEEIHDCTTSPIYSKSPIYGELLKGSNAVPLQPSEHTQGSGHCWSYPFSSTPSSSRPLTPSDSVYRQIHSPDVNCEYMNPGNSIPAPPNYVNPTFLVSGHSHRNMFDNIEPKTYGNHQMCAAYANPRGISSNCEILNLNKVIKKPFDPITEYQHLMASIYGTNAVTDNGTRLFDRNLNSLAEDMLTCNFCDED